MKIDSPVFFCFNLHSSTHAIKFFRAFVVLAETFEKFFPPFKESFLLKIVFFKLFLLISIFHVFYYVFFLKNITGQTTVKFSFIVFFALSYLMNRTLQAYNLQVERHGMELEGDN